MGSKREALDEIMQIAHGNKLSLQDISFAFNLSPQQVQQKTTGLAASIFGYIGGLLVLGGISVLIDMQWPKLGPEGHVLITLIPGYMAFIAGLICAHDEKLEREATPLFLVAAAIQPTGILVALHEYAHGDNPTVGVLFMCGIMLLQQGLVFIATQRTVLAFTSIFFLLSFVATVFDLQHLNGQTIGLIIGGMELAIAHALNKSAHRSIAPVHFFFGSCLFLGAYADFIGKTSFEITFLGLTALFIYGSILERSRILLGVSAIALLSYIGYFTGKYFSGVIGWPIILILMGALMIGIGMMVVKINRRYITDQQ